MTTDLEIARTSLGPLSWLELRGSRREVFFHIGQEYGDVIREFLAQPSERERVARHEASPLLQRVLATTRRLLPEPVMELETMADGAGIPAEELLALNLRGDVGYARDGCSELAVMSRSGPLLAHNEDGPPIHEGDCVFLTLQVDDELPFTTYWYPGMLVGMTFWLNGAGIVCGVDHVPVADPGTGVGRQFLARRLTGATSLSELVGRAGELSASGGYAYMVGDADQGRLLNIEMGPSGVSTTEVLSRLAHTNHFLSLTDRQLLDAQSVPRLEVLGALPPVDTAEQALGLFSDSSGGVWRDGEGGDPLVTLCTVVFDLRGRRVLLRLREDGQTRVLDFEKFLSPTGLVVGRR